MRRDSLKISKRGGLFYAIHGSKEKALLEKDLKAIKEFEQQTRLIGGGGCTTVDTYLISYNGRQQEITDESCNWEGFYLLMKAIFGESFKRA
jgi:hypothetical protein